MICKVFIVILFVCWKILRERWGNFPGKLGGNKNFLLAALVTNIPTNVPTIAVAHKLVNNIAVMMRR